jgi:putative aldouronate transport system substrate-binding protein
MKKGIFINGMLVLLLLLLPALVVFAGGSGDRQSSGGTKVHPMRFVVPQTAPPDYETGIKAVNDKLRADGVDIEVSVIRIPWDQYEQKLNLMMSTGEPFELLHVMNDIKNISALTSRDALLPLDEYLPKYPNLVSKFDNGQWLAGMVNGKTYAVPDYWRSMDYYLGYLYVRTDILEKIGVKEFPLHDVDEVLNVMKRMQDHIRQTNGRTAYHYPHQLSWAPNWLHRSYNTYPFYVENSLGLILARQDGTVDSYFESEEFKKDAAVYRKMFQMGLIHPDILNLPPDTKATEFEQGAGLPGELQLQGNLPNLQEIMPEAAAEQFWLFPEKPNMIFTLGQNMNAVSATAENPESGLKFLNWLYARKENYDLWHYGVEGVHYTRSVKNGIESITDANNTPLYQFEAWMTGFVPYWTFGTEVDQAIVDMLTKESPNRVYSPMAGFIFDATLVSSELASLQTEIIASFYPIKYGLVDFNTAHPEALRRLKAAGLDKYMAEYRRQFAEYLKANPGVIGK